MKCHNFLCDVYAPKATDNNCCGWHIKDVERCAKRKAFNRIDRDVRWQKWQREKEKSRKG